MQFEMFPLQSMDKYLKLKLEVVYRGLPIEVARQRFDELKQNVGVPTVAPAEKPRRKLRKADERVVVDGEEAQ